MFGRMKRQLVHGAAVVVDRAARVAVTRRATHERPLMRASHPARMAFLERCAADYPRAPSLDFFGESPVIQPSVRRVRSEEGLHVFDVTWLSQYVAHSPGIRAHYASTSENRLAVARLFARERPRPMAIMVHGYMTGHFPIEERLWPLEALDRYGFDTALFVLPFHALRGPARSPIPAFPNSDPRITIEGFRQATNDLRGLIGWLRRRGHAHIGLMGMSLGGYTAALTATIEPDLDFLVPLIPLASLADFAKEQGTLSARPREAELEHALLERLYRVASPLSFTPRIPGGRVLVGAARADRVTPVSHARKLANHFSAPLLAFQGGHVLQVGRRALFQRVLELMSRVVRDNGLLPELKKASALPD